MGGPQKVLAAPRILLNREGSSQSLTARKASSDGAPELGGSTSTQVWKGCLLPAHHGHPTAGATCAQGQ